jgi:hypothetical protein
LACPPDDPRLTAAAVGRSRPCSYSWSALRRAACV